ncbi:hypothetical protein E0Z10_g6635 [Xylaria hypoxylon]|uniref:Uncharacterized protein n=1 Tax=Xylaria hypoxylon TaxID=37992 RepID=A0A4Z0YD06_9PEZI|nr:hypothetical protein E0Z10_g6635 [Xylaria hypoxylon]
MARLSLALLVAALLQAGSSLPIVEEGQFSPTSQQSGFPTGLPTGFPTGFPHHQHPLHNLEPEGRPAPPEKRSIPVAPEWLRWLPFESINL